MRIRLATYGLAALLTAATLATMDYVPPVAAARGVDGLVGLVDPSSGVWRVQHPDGVRDRFYYGNPADEPFLGDWDCDGTATPGLYRRSDGFVYLRNSNTEGIADVQFFFGNPGDLPLAGDFNGDGCDTVSIYRPAERRVYIINRLGSNHGGLGAADYHFGFGESGDVALAGDFDGDGVDTVAGFRPGGNRFWIYADPRGTTVAQSFSFGDPGDRPLVIDLEGARDALAVYRPHQRTAYVKNPSGGSFAVALPWAQPGWVPVAGSFRRPPPPPPPRHPPGSDTDTTIYPGETIQKAVEANPEGAAFTIKAGVHRMQTVIPKHHQRFYGEPGAVLNGSRLLTSFAHRHGRWVASGQTQQGKQLGTCARLDGKWYDGCRYPEDVFIDDQPLIQVTSLADLRKGRWYFDYAADEVYLADDPTGRKVEISVSRHAFYFWSTKFSSERNWPTNVTIAGLIVEKYANPAQHGAIHAGGFENGWPGERRTTDWLIENNEVRLNHGAGIRTGNRTIVRYNHVHHNGQTGVRADGHGSIIEGNEISHNNTLLFNPEWEAGGTKFWSTTDLVVRHNNVHHNTGPGLWADTDNRNTLYENNRVVANSGPGIFHEVSYSAVIRYNHVERNGEATSAWLYGAGILVAHSSGVTVHNNTVARNHDGIAGVDQGRGSGAYGPWRLDRFYVYDNVVHQPRGRTGVGQDIGDKSIFQRDIRFYRNTYYFDGNPRPFRWDDRELTPSQWRAYGHDPEGWFN